MIRSLDLAMVAPARAPRPGGYFEKVPSDTVEAAKKNFN